MDDKISVVLPIYNVEKYLNRCLKSVVNQTYKNIEIILVDDGSTDQCPELCEEWSRKDKRIKVIHKENAGLGMARNTGIENATGKYICFFDSDDFISLNAIETLYDVAVLSNADAVLFGFNKVDFKGNVYQSVVPKGEKPVYEGSEVRQIILPDLIAQMPSISTVKNLWMSAWACMYSLELIRKVNWRFVSEREIISEDVYSLLHLYNYIEKVKRFRGKIIKCSFSGLPRGQSQSRRPQYHLTQCPCHCSLGCHRAARHPGCVLTSIWSPPRMKAES